MGNPGLLALAIGLALVAVGVVASAFVWRRRLMWLRRGVSALVLISSIVVGVVWWDTPPPFVNRRAPLPASALEYAATSDNTVTAFQATGGDVVWRRTLMGHSIAALRVETGYIIVVSITSMDVGGNPTGATVTGLDAVSGQTRWQTPLVGYALLDGAGADGMTLFQGRLYLAGFVQGTVSTLMSLDTRTGQVVWRATLSTPFHHTNGWRPTLAADASTVYALVDMRPNFGSIQAFSARDGRALWLALSPQSSDTSAEAQTLQTAQGIVYAASEYGVRAFHATDGAALWRQDYSSPGVQVNTLAVQSGTLYVTGVLKGDLLVYALSATDGATRWRTDLGAAAGYTLFGEQYGSAGNMIVVSNGLVMVQDHFGVFALSAESGVRVWRLVATESVQFELDSTYSVWTSPENERVAPIVMGEVFFMQTVLVDPVPPFTAFPSGKGQLYLYAVNLTTGQPYWRIKRGAITPAGPGGLHF